MHQEIETVKIKCADTESGFMVINKADLKEGDEPFVESADHTAPVEPKEAKKKG